MNPVGPKREPLSLNDCLKEDFQLLAIFQSIVTENYHAIFQKQVALARVCRRWQQVADREELGRAIFKHLGWYFPQDKQWKKEYRLQSGHCFIDNPQPQVTTIAYNPIVDIQYRRIGWIEDKGFIWFHCLKKEFNVCLFNNPMESKTIKTTGQMATLALHHDHLFCGMEDGTLVCFLLNDLENPLFSHQAHKNSLIGIFDYQDTWITVSGDQIVCWDKETRQPQLLLENYNPPASKGYYLSDMQCVNHHLFFYYDPGDSLVDPHFRYKLSLLHPERGLEKISGPKRHDLRQVEPWGDQIGALFHKLSPQYEGSKFLHTHETFTVTRYPFDPLSIYSGEPQNGEPTKKVTWERLRAKMQRLVQLHFRGDSAFVVWEDGGTYIQLINLKGEQKVLFEHFDPAGIFRGTIAKNKFIYLQPKLHQAVILDFPLPSSVQI